MTSHDLSSDARMEAATRGEAMPDGSYPARDCGELKNAVNAYGTDSTKSAGVRRHLIRRSLALGCTEHIPDDWHMEVKRDDGEENRDDSTGDDGSK